ncbi:MAG: peroxiredoxin [Planctomycetaceae bacterium]|nr:peroxiredoxin [Planctomycetaceae bacterium]
MAAQVGKPAPAFEVPAYDRSKDSVDNGFITINSEDLKGKWACLFFYPLDFTFVCPTELVAFNDALADFESRDCALLTASTDSNYSHKAWCESHPGLQQLKYPMIADTNHKLSADYGVLFEEKGIAYRGIFLINPEGIVQWLAIHDLGVGRNVEEVLRVLDALQTGENVPCNWKKGEDTL